jgi:HAD superfamily hydrolase (TIGR01509 family)
MPPRPATTPAGPAAGGAHPLPAAVLWDFDGTLVASEDYWIAEEYALVESFGGSWSQEHAHALVGNELLTTGAYIAEHGPVPLPAAEIVDRLMVGVVDRLRAHVPWRPGVERLLGEVAAAGIPQAMITMSYQSVVDPVLAAMAELGLPEFAAVITGEVVTRGKPDPEPYQRGLAALGVPAGRAVAVEDSRTGARSAAAAGLAVVVTPNAAPVTGEPGWWVLPDLADVHLADLASHLATRP